MAAPMMTSDRRRELAELRSRAYGRDADIHRDSAAVARLLELEKLARIDDSSQPGGAGPAPEAPAAASDGSGEHVASVVPEPTESHDTGALPPGPAASLRPPHRGRRVPRWVYTAAAGFAGLLVGIAVPALSPPHPDAVLSRSAEAGGPALDYEMYRLQADSAVRYDTFHDLEVWSAMTQEGSRCVVVTTANGEWMTAACAPEPLSPTADINFFSGMRQIDGLELADGSVVRFILRADVMEVWIAETDEAA